MSTRTSMTVSFFSILFVFVSQRSSLILPLFVSQLNRTFTTVALRSTQRSSLPSQTSTNRVTMMSLCLCSLFSCRFRIVFVSFSCRFRFPLCSVVLHSNISTNDSVPLSAAMLPTTSATMSATVSANVSSNMSNKLLIALPPTFVPAPPLHGFAITAPSTRIGTARG